MIFSRKIITTALFMVIPGVSLSYDYDLIIIGSNTAGLHAATLALKYKKRVALVDQDPLIKNINFCYAMKLLSHYGYIAYLSKFYGVGLNALFTSHDQNNRPSVLKSITDWVQMSQKMHDQQHLESANLKRLFGKVYFLDKNTISVNNNVVTAEKFLIAIDSKLKTSNTLVGLDEVDFLNESRFFQQQKVPSSLIVVGSDPTTVELACACAHLGVDVTIVSRYGILLHDFDFEVVNALMSYMQDIGVNLQLEKEVTHIEKDQNENVVLHCVNDQDQIETFTAEKVYFALSKEADVSEMGLQNASVRATKKKIYVDSHLKTTADNIYACSDIAGVSDRTTKLPVYQAQIAIYNMFCTYWQRKKVVDYANVSRIVHSTIPLASVGLTEQEAIKHFGNIKVRIDSYDPCVCRLPFGIAKFIFDENGVILGVHVFGEGAAEIVDTVQTGKNMKEQPMRPLLNVSTPFSILELISFEGDLDECCA